MPSIFVLPDNTEVNAAADETILAASLEAGIHHTHVCGGRARCSTCRVVVFEGLEHCTPRTHIEDILAKQLHFPPTIRLACQTKITDSIKIRRLVLDNEDIHITSQLDPNSISGTIGEEQFITILFADIRNFTTFADTLPPYDIVHALNRYYRQMNKVISDYDGEIINYMGDGLLAVFPEQQKGASVQNGVLAGLAMLQALEGLQSYFEAVYSQKLNIGIGVHYGQVVIGNLGIASWRHPTAIGDAVNVASRIETANKALGTRFLMSEVAYKYVENQIQIGRVMEVELKGKVDKYTLYEVIGFDSQAK